MSVLGQIQRTPAAQAGILHIRMRLIAGCLAGMGALARGLGEKGKGQSRPEATTGSRWDYLRNPWQAASACRKLGIGSNVLRLIA